MHLKFRPLDTVFNRDFNIFAGTAHFLNRPKFLTHRTGVKRPPPMLSKSGPAETDLLSNYYKEIFPAEKLFRWLFPDSFSSAVEVSRREFSFTLPGGIYTRFLSFNGVDDFVSRLLALNPVKIDVGAIYNMRPSERKCAGHAQFRPIRKELVFDIDMTDYDDVRNCCR